MPVTVPASPGDAAHPGLGRRVDPALYALDERLFNPSSWFAIDVNNRAVKGVVIPTLADGLALVGKGRVAAIVGRLRAGTAVVDIDMPPHFGHWLAFELAGWMATRGWWHLLRPSGGGAGRFHLFVAPPTPADRDELAAHLAALAAEMKLRRGDLDLRDAVRPLSSPHRHGATTRPKGDLREALRGLTRAFPDLPDQAPLGGRTRVRARTRTQATADAARGNVVPLFPGPVRGRDLTPQWRRYLHTGIPPTESPRDPTGGVSLTEAGLTLELVWAGFDAAAAWQVIRESHPQAMTKAKHQGWSWWVKYVWNPAVDDVTAFSPTPPHRPTTAPLEVRQAVADARERLQRLMWTQPVRSRPALLLVGHTVLDRMLRTGRMRVPCPERDLVLDTGISDRKTIRSALRRLHGALGTLHTDCLSPSDRATTSFEFEIEAVETTGGRIIPPPASHPPPRPRGLWATLPRASHSLWRVLLGSSEPATTADLAVASGLVEEPTSRPSKSQLATTKQALCELAKAGLARPDENGCWSMAVRPRSVHVEESAARAYAELREAIDAERAAFRAGLTSNWTAGRARAFKAARARERAWWNSLSPADRAARTASKRLEFDQLSLSQQAALKARLAERRINSRHDELEHYQAWLRSLAPDDYLARSQARKERFRSLSTAARGSHVAAWDRHRLRYGLTSQRYPDLVGGPSTLTPTEERAELLPDGPHTRDSAFLERQGSLIDDTAPPRRGEQAAG